MSRRTKYNEDIVKNIEASLKEGEGRISTCKNVNIHYSTFLDWLDNNSEFSERIKKAEAQGAQTTKESLMGVIKDAAKNKNKPVWQAAAWYLERKFPAEFAAHQQIHQTSEQNKQPTQVIIQPVRTKEELAIENKKKNNEQ